LARVSNARGSDWTMQPNGSQQRDIGLFISMRPKAQIICTIGPSSQGPSALLGMAQAGMDVARINFSHGNHFLYRAFIDGIRCVNQKHGQHIRILQDLEGYRLRIGHLKAPVVLKEGQEIWMAKMHVGMGEAIPLESELPIANIVPGMNIYVDDGMILLKVLESTYQALRIKVIYPGVIKSRKGVNIPELKFPRDVLTAKDKKDIEFGIHCHVDYIAQSFVRNRWDIEHVMERVRPHLPQCKIIAKIDNQEGLDNIDEIIDVCDGIMVARGDLGVSLPMWQVPVAQKDIINRCNRKGKMVITATQMLESMVNSPRPTRAEVSDVANAVLDGTDAVMLSAETAVGNFPVESVRMMREIVDFTHEAYPSLGFQAIEAL